jgi:hypothetical protein
MSQILGYNFLLKQKLDIDVYIKAVGRIISFLMSDLSKQFLRTVVTIMRKSIEVFKKSHFSSTL